MTPKLARSPKRAFTLVELIVVLAIVCLLIALTLPTVQSAREAASRARCQSNLRQIGVALHSYVAAYNCFPITYAINYDYKKLKPISLNMCSVHVRLLPYLDNKPLYDSINFDVSTTAPDTILFKLTEQELAWNAMNATASGTAMSVFLCPSDDGPFAETGNNYRASVGVGPQNIWMAEFPDSGNGLFDELSVTSPSRVPDGLSQTAAFSERIRGSGDSERLSPEQDYYIQQVTPFTADDLIRSCRISARPGAEGFVFGGRWWFYTGRERTLYNHAQAPNGTVPDCFTGGHRPALGMATARSWHNGGVNVLMGDGATRFVSEGIAQRVLEGLRDAEWTRSRGIVVGFRLSKGGISCFRSIVAS